MSLPGTGIKRALLGAAGTGKSTKMRQETEEHSDILVTATTGVAAINMGEGVGTVNSVLGFYDVSSFQTAKLQGWIRRRLDNIAQSYSILAIDEISMMPSVVLQGLVEELDKVNIQRVGIGRRPLGLYLIGDFLQLPPVVPNGQRVPYAFLSQCWKDFSVEVMTTNYRQAGDALLASAMNVARRGNGAEVMRLLRQGGTRFVATPHEEFDGVTLMPINKMVDSYNNKRLAKLTTPEITYTAQRWGKQCSEWKDIPEKLSLRQDALVMVLTNQAIYNEGTKTYEFVNGDTGHLVDGGAVSLDGEVCEVQATIKLLRNEKEISVNKVVRQNLARELPTGTTKFVPDSLAPAKPGPGWRQYQQYMTEHCMGGIPYFDPLSEKWVIGEICYMPLRIAYALSFHKVQGLTLPRIQVDARNIFAGKPQMMYVALSRALTANEITIVGEARVAGQRVCTASEVRQFI